MLREQGGALRSRRRLVWKGPRGWNVKRIKCQEGVGPSSFFTQGCLVWVSYLAMVESMKLMASGFLPLVKVFGCMATPSKMSPMTRNGIGASLTYCSDPLLAQRVPHSTQDATLTHLLTSDIYSEKLNSQNIRLQGLLWNWRSGLFQWCQEMLFQNRHWNAQDAHFKGNARCFWTSWAWPVCCSERVTQDPRWNGLWVTDLMEDWFSAHKAVKFGF